MVEKKQVPSEELSDKLTAILKNLPKQPGVYKMLDKDGDLLYIGKAKDLSKRVKSYFRDNKGHTVRTKKMVEKIADIELIVVDTELEALILETNLIKEFKPYYNVVMKDDKNYVYVRVSVQDDFPIISIVRKIKQDGARYFGPKTAAWRVKQTLKLLKKLFPYRHCHLTIDWLPDKADGLEAERVEIGNKVIKYPCLDYHIKRCCAPCIGKVTPTEYRELIDQIISFLEGDIDGLIARLKSTMADLAKERKFEQAALLRDRLQFLQDMQEQQKISEPVQEDVDVVSFVVEQGHYFFSLLEVRSGKLIANEQFVLKAELIEEDQDDSEVLSGFLTQYYQSAASIPRVIVVPRVLPEENLLLDWLKARAGHAVELRKPARGRKYSLLELAEKNARMHAKQMKVKWVSEEKPDPELALKDLKELLNLPRLPKRIECYDISHLQGTEMVGSMVVFQKGLSSNKDYRHFRIRSLDSGEIDDFAALREVLARRLKYLLKLPEGWRLAQLTKKDGALLSELEKAENIVEKWKDLPAEQVWGLKIKKDLSAIIWLDEEDQLQWYWLTKKMQKPDLVLLTAIAAVFKKLKLKKIYLSSIILDQVSLADYELGANVDRTQADRYVLEKFRFSFADQSLAKKPDLLLIDGGKGQLSSVRKVLKELGLDKDIPVVSLAKRLETVFQPADKLGVVLKDEQPAKFLLQQLRDEAHRFAITYNRNQRGKKMSQSVLDEVPGVGDTFKNSLLRHFGSVDAIKAATEKELADLTNKRVAKAIKSYLS